MGGTSTFSGVHILETHAIPAFEHERGIAITHDERGAPVATRADGTEDTRLLLSLTDEDELTFCGWVQREEGSRLVGLGIDLVPLDAFAGNRGEYLNGLLLTEYDRAVIRETWPDAPETGAAYAFSAKEAAFKACAAPLRRWYETHDEELAFDVRSFELMDATHARGTARQGAAQRAMDAMGIANIELNHELRGPYLLTCALALGMRQNYASARILGTD